MATGFTTVTGSHLIDATGTLIANATIYFRPVDNKGNSISFRVGAMGEGQTTSQPVSTTVSTGVFSLQLADTTLTTPANVGYAVTVIDNVSGNSLLGPGYGCIQPTGSTWSFDTYLPNYAAQTLLTSQSYAGAGTLTGSHLPPGGVDSTAVTLTSATVGCTCLVEYADGSDPTDGGHVSLNARCATAGSVVVERRPWSSPFFPTNLLANGSFEIPASSGSGQIVAGWLISFAALNAVPLPSPFVSSITTTADDGVTALRFTLNSEFLNSPTFFESIATAVDSFSAATGDVFSFSARTLVTNVLTNPGAGPFASLIGRLITTYADATQTTSDQLIGEFPTSGYVGTDAVFTIPTGTAPAVSATFAVVARIDNRDFSIGTPVTAGQAVFTVDSVALARTYSTQTKDVTVRVIL